VWVYGFAGAPSLSDAGSAGNSSIAGNNAISMRRFF